MRAIISPNIFFPQVYSLLFLKSLSGHLDVVQLDEARRTSARADRAPLYTRASALLYRSWRGARAAELYGNWKWSKMLKLRKLAYTFTGKSFKHKKKQTNTHTNTICKQHTVLKASGWTVSAKTRMKTTHLFLLLLNWEIIPSNTWIKIYSWTILNVHT